MGISIIMFRFLFDCSLTFLWGRFFLFSFFWQGLFTDFVLKSFYVCNYFLVMLLQLENYQFSGWLVSKGFIYKILKLFELCGDCGCWFLVKTRWIRFNLISTPAAFVEVIRINIDLRDIIYSLIWLYWLFVNFLYFVVDTIL